jgi:hypothetical protein
VDNAARNRRRRAFLPELRRGTVIRRRGAAGSRSQQTWQPTPQAAPQQNAGYQQAQQGYHAGRVQQYQQQYQQQAQPERTYEPDGDPHSLGIARSPCSRMAVCFCSFRCWRPGIPLCAVSCKSGPLLLLLGQIALGIVGSILIAIFMMITSVLGAIIGFLMWAGFIFLWVLAIIGIVHVCKGEMKPLPLIGGIQIIKM